MSLEDGKPLTNMEQRAILELIGDGVVLLHTNQSSDPAKLSALVGFLTARLLENTLVKRLAAIEQQLADIQRASAARN
jgi:hypothetical protein